MEGQSWWWLSTERLTVGVLVDVDMNIIRTAPIAMKFRGRPLRVMELWMRQQKGFRMKRLK